MSLIASMMRSASASDAPVSTRITRPSPATRNDFTTPRLGIAIRQGTIFTPSIGKCLRMLTIACPSFGKVYRRLFDRRDDVAVSCAAAEVAGDRLLDLYFGRFVSFAKQPVCRHEHAGCAVAALHRVVFPKRFLQWMQSLVLRQTFDGDDFVAVRLNGVHHARLHRVAIPHHGTRTAAADDAAQVRAGQSQAVSEKVSQQRPRLRLAGVRFPINSQRNCLSHLLISPALSR